MAHLVRGIEQLSEEQQKQVLKLVVDNKRDELEAKFPNCSDALDLIDLFSAIEKFDDKKIKKLIECIRSNNRNRLNKEFPEIPDKNIIIAVLLKFLEVSKS